MGPKRTLSPREETVSKVALRQIRSNTTRIFSSAIKDLSMPLDNNAPVTRHRQSLRLQVLLACLPALCTALLTSPVRAQSNATPRAANSSPWTISAGLGVARVPEYEGAKRTATGIAPDLNISYKTDGWGTIALGSKARGLSWNFLDTKDYSLGLVLQLDGGRTDKKDGSLLQPGGKRLRGMGEIRSSPEFGVAGSVVFGVPFYAQLTKGSGDGKAKGQDFRIKGHGGTRLEVGAEIPFPITESLTASVSPNLTWADKKYTQTYFGVTRDQATRSGFREFDAKGGIKSVGLSLGVDYRFAPQWSANAGVSYSRLRGDAAKSPIVEKTGSTSVSAGIAYQF